ncbi:hypothetical protein ADUPG1_010106 [Aduncisulcus paluster]|uniref:Uncharacterized protein n=1 Tax=Aduncisulcus paluster TaxID=2918883 RepID=A0ABQ5KXW5_9EUKA|nr:hypothetical protein ADUPG1_010106 [Aduncisulcus paluster]|eukprot:gnl/Carplike_NY0171/3508_a4739_506.p1 GENE.gnl/Carplike_NY0171/3508_a4739_506~~gnl/Carplike_NY0171/3508_a4739_506.p1  ORF type:complete len:111 (+),score=23.56 gnl/Carplike_NY0171/3508_a4739_506:40-372(+)
MEKGHSIGVSSVRGTGTSAHIQRSLLYRDKKTESRFSFAPAEEERKAATSWTKETLSKTKSQDLKDVQQRWAAAEKIYDQRSQMIDSMLPPREIKRHIARMKEEYIKKFY